MHPQEPREESLETLMQKNQHSLQFMQKALNRSDRAIIVKKVLSAGETALKSGDEETAFVKFMFFLELIKYLRTIEKDKAFMTHMYGKTAKETLNKLDQLQESLILRYELKKKQKELITASSESNIVVADSEPKSAPVVLEKPTIEGQKSIDAPKLLELMKEPLLLVDVRSSEEFIESHIIHKTIINVSPTILAQKKSANMIGEGLPEDVKSIWSRRNEFKYIVLVDRSSEIENLKNPSPLWDAFRAINEWDPNTKYENKAVILNGGYAEWLNFYPTLCTNPRVQFPSRDVSVIQLDEIQYPKSEDVFDEPKPVVIPPKIIPTIPDRNKKPLFNESKGDVPSSIPVNTHDLWPDIKPENSLVEQSKINDAPSKPKQPSMNSREESLMSEINEKLRINGGTKPFKPLNNFNGDQAEPTIFLHPLKPDGQSKTMPSHSSMKRSLSLPKINQLNEEGAGAAPIPDRSSKPLLQKNTEQYKIRDLRDFDPVCGKVTPGLTGLKNLRNTCYMNSILQCLSNTQALNSFFRAKDFQKNCKSKTEGTIAEEFRTVIFKLWAGDYKSFACKNLKNKIGHYRNTFSGYDQQDSHEFLTILIDWLHEDLKRAPPLSYLVGASEENGERAWGEFKKNNDSPIQELFYGQQRSVVTCTRCHERSITFEPFSNLSLPLPSGKDSCTLSDCLDLYVQEETIFGWECPKCKTSRSAEKKLDITRLPPILVIHFKRFTSDGWCRKQQTYVDFPVKDTLDMSKFLFGVEHRNVYFSLYAVSNHYGTMDSGHYTAYCKGAKTNKWYKFDDQEVCEISPDSVKTAAAYIVFYSKLDLGNT